MTTSNETGHEGRCTCGAVRYRLTAPPLFVHGCHCTWCQRETGTAFAVNALIETACLEVLSGGLERVDVPSASGSGQILVRCPRCQVVVWSHYSGAGETTAFVRVGTLDDPAAAPPDIHIYTSTKLPWVVLPDGVPAVPEYYRRSEYWPADSVARFKAARDA